MAGSTRRFVTRADVEDAAKAGRTMQVGARDVVTDEATTRARDLGVTLTRSESAGDGPRTAAAPTADSAALRRAVRAAVISELGREPAGLDAALDRALSRR